MKPPFYLNSVFDAAKRFISKVAAVSVGIVTKEKGLKKVQAKMEFIKLAKAVHQRLSIHEKSVVSGYASKARKVRDGVGNHRFIHPSTPAEYLK